MDKTTPNQKTLTQALTTLKGIQDAGFQVVKTDELPRSQREILIKNGFLQPIIAGWYMSTHPNDKLGDTTPWVSSMMKFIQRYATSRFHDDWCVDPDLSIKIHTGSNTLPKQIVLHSTIAGNSALKLPFDSSLFDYRIKDAIKKEYIKTVQNIRVLSLPYSLIKVSDSFFQTSKTDAVIALRILPDASDVIRILLAEGLATSAGRLAGAFRAIQREDIADEINQTMTSVGYRVIEKNPFLDQRIETSSSRATSPYVERITLMWNSMREDVLNVFADQTPPTAPRSKSGIDLFMKDIEENYVFDAYNSLSIEGYKVTAALIERVANGDWSPLTHASDKNAHDAMAAHGYWKAHNAVKSSIRRLLEQPELNQGSIARNDHRTWYRELFSPSVDAKLLTASDLAGYRNNPIFIRNARHIPPSMEAVRELMPTLFDLLEKEKNPAVSAVLGHLTFVFIHPYMDGNGRIARFLMNTMLCSAGYPWVVIPVNRRDEYMASLNSASADANIIPFAKFISSCIPTASQKNPDSDIHPERSRSDFPSH